MIVVDANFLVLLLDPSAMPHIERGHDRVTEFINTSDSEIIIPAPVIAEIVAGRLDRVEEIMETFRKQRRFYIQPLDEVIAIEVGYVIRAALEKISPNERPKGWRTLMKYDAMIAATAKVRGASAIITGDSDFNSLLRGSSIKVIQTKDLPLPPASQQSLFDDSSER